MGYDVLTSRCGCGRILKRLEQCQACISLRRAEAVAKAGPEQKRFSGSQWYESKLPASAMPTLRGNDGSSIQGKPFLGGVSFSAGDIKLRADPSMPRDTVMLMPALGGFVDMSAPVSSADVFRREQQYQRELGNLPMLSDMQPEKREPVEARVAKLDKINEMVDAGFISRSYGVELKREALGLPQVQSDPGKATREAAGCEPLGSGRRVGKHDAAYKAAALEKWCRDMGIPVR